MFHLVGQHKLQNVSWDFIDHRVEAGSIFPFFDRKGVVRKVMLTSEDSSEILLVPYRPDLFKRGWFRPHRIDLERSHLRNFRMEDPRKLEGLWHFDPWWKLTDDRFALQPAVTALRSTNIPGFDKPFDRLWFDSNLGRVRRVGIGKGEDAKTKKFTPKYLKRVRRLRSAIPAPSATSRPGRSGWKLRPFWES